MNERDSEAVAAQLVARGYTLAKSEAAADVVLLNTCSVRDFAEQKAINKMQNIVGTARSEKRDQIVGFMGCMAQSRGRELIDRLPDVDLVLGTQKFHRAAEYIDERASGTRLWMWRRRRRARRRFANICSIASPKRRCPRL
jgi:tRNA-2-methylthio-N6-dimethylallyladenosine synthase